VTLQIASDLAIIGLPTDDQRSLAGNP